MIILSHRGYWKSAPEKNTPAAFHRSFDLGFGTETDVRDRNGELVISHDMPDGSEITLAAMLDILDGRDLPLAINIKADGLARPLNEQMNARGLTRWFTFDMSVPEMAVQLRLGLPVFSRARASTKSRRPAMPTPPAYGSTPSRRSGMTSQKSPVFCTTASVYALCRRSCTGATLSLCGRC